MKKFLAIILAALMILTCCSAIAEEKIDAASALSGCGPAMDAIEMLQSDVMDAYNASFIGKDLEILVDGYDEEFEQFYGRTYADSPEIDGRVWIASEEALVEGTFVWVCIDGMIDGDLSGYIVEE